MRMCKDTRSSKQKNCSKINSFFHILEYNRFLEDNQSQIKLKLQRNVKNKMEKNRMQKIQGSIILESK